MFWAHRTIVRLAACLGAVIWLLAAPDAQAQMKKLSLDEMVAKSDNIFTAICTDRKVVVQNNNIVTKYKLRVNENWKGRVRTSKAGEVDMEELGGAVARPLPVTQFVPGMANMAPQEEVLLFTANPTFDPKMSANQKHVISPESMRIVGRSQGRFTIFRHPETGEALVSRVGVEPYPGSVKTPLFNRIERLESKTSDPLTRTRIATQSPEQMAEREKLGKKVDEIAARAAAENTGASGDIVSYEALSSVKSRVAKSMEKQAVKP